MRLNIQWSKHKKVIEDRICDNLKRRICIYLTHYRAVHEPESRFWITFDRREICSISKMKWLNQWAKVRENYLQSGGTEDEYDYATKVLNNNGDYYVDDIQDSLEEYINLSIEEALTSSEFIIRALSMIDRRLGKRRLASMVMEDNEHPLVKEMYKIRCGAEGIHENR